MTKRSMRSVLVGVLAPDVVERRDRSEGQPLDGLEQQAVEWFLAAGFSGQKSVTVGDEYRVFLRPGAVMRQRLVQLLVESHQTDQFIGQRFIVSRQWRRVVNLIELVNKHSSRESK